MPSQSNADDSIAPLIHKTSATDVGLRNELPASGLLGGLIEIDLADQRLPLISDSHANLLVQAVEPMTSGPAADAPVIDDSLDAYQLSPDRPSAVGPPAAEMALPGGDGTASEVDLTSESLTLADVIASLYRSYPEIEAARQQWAVANGQLLGAWGAFDTKLGGHTLNEPTGFYENYRHGIGVARQTWWGGYVSAGYRVGRGVFQPWYLERETETGGEFKIGTAVPLLQGRAIDPNRVAVFQATLEREAADPIVQQSILDAARMATQSYWKWVALGAELEAQQLLLDLAETRGDKIEKGVKAQLFAEISLILNGQLIAERKAKVLETQQKFQAAAIKLSLFLRTDAGLPLVPDASWLPNVFPILQDPELDLAQSISLALAQRPEPRILQIKLRQLGLDRRLANNQMLPRLDFVSEVSQDVGDAASKSDDKGELVLVIGLQGEVPIQRSKARGKRQEVSGKIAQVNQKLRLQRDKITTDVQTALYRLELAQQVVEQNLIGLEAAVETVRRYSFAFEKGKIDLIYLNLLEQKANETQIKLIGARQEWFDALAMLQGTIGIDPLEQAMAVSALPPSEEIDISIALSRASGQDSEEVDVALANDGE